MMPRCANLPGFLQPAINPSVSQDFKLALNAIMGFFLDARNALYIGLGEIVFHRWLLVALLYYGAGFAHVNNFFTHKGAT